MSKLSQEPYFKPAEDLAQYLSDKTQSTSISFFRTLVDYNFCKLASVMRINIDTHERGVIPINMYAMSLAPSGMGKGHATNIMEQTVLKGFRTRFLQDVLPEITEENLTKLADARAKKKNKDPEDELLLVKAEFDRQGTFVFNFDSATTPAVKQMRHKLLMCGAGAVSMEIDEVGSNLLSNQEVITTLLELYDVGLVKPKLTKNTNDNVRGEEIEGKTPANLLMYGTPAKVLNGSKVEEEVISMLETGYARRCFFAYVTETNKRKDMTPEEVYDSVTDISANNQIQSLASQLELLADSCHFNIDLTMQRDVALKWIKYRLDCENIADELSEHDEIRKAEISHRYFKAMKLAGAYAFVDGSYEVKMEHLNAAIRRAEESGTEFTKILTRDRPYVKLAKFISTIGTEVTNVDLVEELPFYRGSASQKGELFNLATAWGYRHNVVLKKYWVEGIEFFKGETLEKTDLDSMILSHSGEWVENFSNETAKFEELQTLFDIDNYNWVNHHLVDGYRKEDNAMLGFNMVAFDVDGTATLKEAQTFLSGYMYYMYTTKRHGENGEDRFRIIIPLSHKLNMDKEEYHQFMQNIANWLPIEVDDKTFQRARKWLTNKTDDSKLFYNGEGDCLDALLFIPKTSKGEELKGKLADMSNLSNLERWFLSNTGDGNRSNQLVKFALMLVDAGKSYDEVDRAVKDFNGKLSDSLSEAELSSTILVTATKAILKREKS